MCVPSNLGRKVETEIKLEVVIRKAVHILCEWHENKSLNEIIGHHITGILSVLFHDDRTRKSLKACKVNWKTKQQSEWKNAHQEIT